MISGATTLAFGAGLARQRVARNALAKKRASFIEGLPRFEKSVAQDELAKERDRLVAARDGLDALAEATPYLAVPDVPVSSAAPEAALVALVDSFMQDARTSLAIACGEAETLALLEEDPEAFLALRASGVRAFDARPSLESARAAVFAHRSMTSALVAKLESTRAFKPGSIEDTVTTMAHASALGAMGAKVGAAIGTLVLPGIGTIVGTALGGLAAGVGGATAARELAKREDEAAYEASRRAQTELYEGLPGSARRALAAIARASITSRAALDEARREAVARPPSMPSKSASVAVGGNVAAGAVPEALAVTEARALTTELLRALSWRLDQGASLLDSEGYLLGAKTDPFLSQGARDAENDIARRALAAKKRSHARATEALRSALREDDPIRSLGWISAVPLPSHPEVDEIFEKLARLLTGIVREETSRLTRRRAALATAFTTAVRTMFVAMDTEVRRHAAERERVLARFVAPR